ncbi:MAG TPA: DUF4938 domain-containing protein, partial [Roseiflexaceae bacterium]|nr:DUF4938 domain-containing protein [Roseiflexaceae bacterium]
MPTEIVQLLGFDGPNLHGPQPGVFLKLRADKDRSRRVKDALKDGAQGAGMVMGYLEIDSVAEDGGYIICASFTTPTPAIGVELARYVVDGLNAEEAGDEEWDAEGPLWELQKRRRAEALPLPALQLIADAAARGIPSLVRADGQVQLGYGARGWAFDPAAGKRGMGDRDGRLAPADIGVGSPAAAAPAPIEPPWERLGPIPIVATAGGVAHDAAARLIAATLQAHGQAVGLAESADLDATRALLADPAAAIAIVGLAAEGIARRGVAFERCAYSAVIDLPDELPAEVADPGELARVLGVPMLLTDPAGCVALNADQPEIAALAEYAPCPIIYISTAEESPLVGFHRAEGGRALFLRAGAVVAASGASEQPILAATLAPAELPGALAGLALL